MPVVYSRFSDLDHLNTFGSSFRHIFWPSFLGDYTQIKGTITQFARLRKDLIKADDQAI